ncbi:MAG TPA: hypothetical protein VLW25_06675 [Bryobacteraceae bacterium]|nr:hypothetical protein [Bryobacteraceae bacterium]
MLNQRLSSAFCARSWKSVRRYRPGTFHSIYHCFIQVTHAAIQPPTASVRDDLPIYPKSRKFDIPARHVFPGASDSRRCNDASACSLEKLHGTFVLLGCRTRLKRSQVLAPPGLRILFPRIQAIGSAPQFANHSVRLGASSLPRLSDALKLTTVRMRNRFAPPGSIVMEVFYFMDNQKQQHQGQQQPQKDQPNRGQEQQHQPSHQGQNPNKEQKQNQPNQPRKEHEQQPTR